MCSWSSMIQTCFSGSYGLILIWCGPRPHGSCANILSRCGHSSTILPVAIDDDRSSARSGAPSRASRSGSHVAREAVAVAGGVAARRIERRVRRPRLGALRQRQLAALRDPDAIGRSRRRRRRTIPTSSRRASAACRAAAWASPRRPGSGRSASPGGSGAPWSRWAWTGWKYCGRGHGQQRERENRSGHEDSAAHE